MKHKQTMFAHYRKDYNNKPEYTLSQSDMTNFGLDHIVICKVEVEYETPDDFNPVPGQIEALQARKHELVKQFTQKIEEIKEQISKLEALEYSEAA